MRSLSHANDADKELNVPPTKMRSPEMRPGSLFLHHTPRRTTSQSSGTSWAKEKKEEEKSGRKPFTTGKRESLKCNVRHTDNSIKG